VKSYNTLKICLHELKEEDIYFNKEVNIPGITVVDEICGSLEATLIDVSADCFSIEDFTKVPDKSKVQFLIMTG